MWPFHQQAPRQDRTSHRLGRRAWLTVEAVEDRVSLSGLTALQLGAIHGFNPQPDPPTMRGATVEIIAI